MTWLEPEDFLTFTRARGPLLDVRAPIEYRAGHLPNSFNLPILDDAERAAVGTLYKTSGQQAAIELGHSLVGGTTKASRVEAWRELMLRHPRMILTCARGGMRSELAQSWLRDVGIERVRVRGGVRALRQFYIEHLERLASREFRIIAGPTGVGKTALLVRLQDFGAPTIDLERMAQHRGSAFGSTSIPQPAQGSFENEIAQRLIELEASAGEKSWWIEDESRMIGHLVIPPRFHAAMQEAPLVVIEESLDLRVENTFREYVLETALGSAQRQDSTSVYDGFRHALRRISNRLGGQRTSEILALINHAETAYSRSGDLGANRAWIVRLLSEYYDPLYLHSLSSRTAHIVFRGTAAEATAYVRESTEPAAPRE